MHDSVSPSSYFDCDILKCIKLSRRLVFACKDQGKISIGAKFFFVRTKCWRLDFSLVIVHAVVQTKNTHKCYTNWIDYSNGISSITYSCSISNTYGWEDHSKEKLLSTMLYEENSQRTSFINCNGCFGYSGSSCWNSVERIEVQDR